MPNTAPSAFAKPVAVWNVTKALIGNALPADQGELTFDRAISFYSHTTREPAGATEDADLGINRLHFSNLYPASIILTAEAAAAGSASAGGAPIVIHDQLRNKLA